MRRPQTQHTTRLNRDSSHRPSGSDESGGEQPVGSLLVPDQGFVGGRTSNLVFVVLAASIGQAQREDFQHQPVRELGRAAR